MENLVKLLPVIAVVALVVIILHHFRYTKKAPRSDWASGYPNSVSGACR